MKKFSDKLFKKRLLYTWGKYKFFLVNGENIRKFSMEDHEFGNYAIHDDMTQIPKDEAWIDEITEPEEQRIIILSSLIRLRCLDKGMSSKKAYHKSVVEDSKIRAALHGEEFHPRHRDIHFYYALYTTVPSEGLTVYLIDGEKVRDLYKTDFIEGGHHYVYKWIPSNEIWLEKDMHKDELPATYLHEYVEMLLMKYKNKKYDIAHKMASEVEFAMEGKFHKEDIKGFIREEAFNLVDKYAKEN